MEESESNQTEEVKTPLRKIEWLAEFLDLSVAQTYEAVRDGSVPAECVIRLRRRIRVNEDLVRAWAAGRAVAS